MLGRATRENKIRDAFSKYNRIKEGPQWYQGDHSIFIQNNRPAVALTSDNLGELLSEIVHTEKDKPEIIECSKLAEIAESLYDLILKVNDEIKTII